MIGFFLCLVAASAPAPVATRVAAIATPPMRRAGTRSIVNIWASPFRTLPECSTCRQPSLPALLPGVGVPRSRQPGAGGVRGGGGEQDAGGAGEPRRGIRVVTTEPAHLHLRRLVERHAGVGVGERQLALLLLLSREPGVGVGH